MTTQQYFIVLLGFCGLTCDAFLLPINSYQGCSLRSAGLTDFSSSRPSPFLSLTQVSETSSVGAVDGPFILTEEEDVDRLCIIEAERRVESLQLQLKAKQAQHEVILQSLKAEMTKKENTLIDRVQYFANQLQQLRFDSHKQLMATKSSFEQRESQLRLEVDALKSAVVEAQEVAQNAIDASHDMMTKRMELEKDLSFLSKRYQTDMQDWEDRVEYEQDARRREKRIADDKLARAVADGKRQLQIESERLTLEMERLRSDMAFRLAQKEAEIGRVRHRLELSRQDLVQREREISDLLVERKSLRKLAKISWGLVTNRVANQWNRIIRRRDN